MIGPHGIDLSLPRGVTRTRLRNKSEKVKAQLKATIPGRKALARASSPRGGQ